MGERQTAALRPEQDQGAPREAWRVSTSRPPAGCTPPPVSRVPCRELPLSLRASSERGAVGRVRRRKDKSTSFSGFPSPAPPQRPTWLLQALTQKQLPSLRTHGVAERCRAVWLESGKPGRGFPSASFHGMSGCLCSAQLPLETTPLQGLPPTQPLGILAQRQSHDSAQLCLVCSVEFSSHPH